MLEKGNPLHSKYINKAVKGILENVGKDGKVMNVSAGTAVMKDRDGYTGFGSFLRIILWGQGLTLAFFSGLLTANDTAKDGAL